MTKNDNLAKIAINKSLLKEYRNNKEERIVYLNDGDEFQISIFNPYDYVIGVSFSFNTNNVDNSQLLVLKPGERVWLDRYLNEARKLLFSTYEVDDCEDAKKAIVNNGLLNIFFYKEREYHNNYNIYNYDYHNLWNDNNITYTNAISSAATYNSSAIYNSSVVNSSITTACLSDSISTVPFNTSLGISSDTIETGRIDKGNHSNQKFNNYYGDFNSYAFKTETIKLLPMSQKQVNANDLQKIYCYNCGRKLKNKFKYCPYCGSKI